MKILPQTFYVLQDGSVIYVSKYLEANIFSKNELVEIIRLYHSCNEENMNISHVSINYDEDLPRIKCEIARLSKVIFLLTISNFENYILHNK